LFSRNSNQAIETRTTLDKEDFGQTETEHHFPFAKKSTLNQIMKNFDSENKQNRQRKHFTSWVAEKTQLQSEGRPGSPEFG
jgi:hypothetical protein